MSKLQERAKVARMRMEHRAVAEPVQLFLPGMEAFVRAMPNHIARSSLFAPLPGGASVSTTRSRSSRDPTSC